MLTRTIDRSRKEGKETVVSACNLFGVSRQVYYRSRRSLALNQQRASETIKLVCELRRQLPRLGTRKLHYLLQERLNHLGVGRDKLFAILRANHMLIKAKGLIRKQRIHIIVFTNTKISLKISDLQGRSRYGYLISLI